MGNDRLLIVGVIPCGYPIKNPLWFFKFSCCLTYRAPMKGAPTVAKSFINYYGETKTPHYLREKCQIRFFLRHA
jgi:hypothetical protein